MSIITLVGMMGCGKSTIGKEVATITNKHFFDIDNIISKISPIKDIFTHHGERYFRELEYQIIAQILSNTDDCIISPGGGAFIEKKTRTLLLQKTTTVWIQATLPTILSRITQDITRPLSSHVNKELFDFRNTIYKQAIIHISCDHLNPTEIAETIVDRIN